MWDLALDTRIILLSAVSAMVIVFLLFTIIGYQGSDPDLFNFYIYAEAMKSGLVPYKDFSFEFPPFALIFFLIPSLFTSDLGTYSFIFGLEVISFVTFTLYFVIKIADKLKVNKLFISLIFMLFVMLYFDHLLKKFDIFVTAFMILSLYLFLFNNRKHTQSYAAMTVATLIKIYPAILLLMMVVLDLNNRKNPHRANTLLKGAFACGLITAISMVPLILMSVPIGDILSYVGFHADRGFQVESIVAVIVENLASIGITTAKLIPAHYTFDVASPICDMLLPYWTYICLIVFALILALVWHRLRSISELLDSPQVPIVFSVILILTFMLLNKVFSTQYIVWLYPLLPFLIISGKDQINLKMAFLITAMIFLSIVIPIFSPYDDWFPIINLMRDIVLVYIFIQLLLFILGKKSVIHFTKHKSVDRVEKAESAHGSDVSEIPNDAGFHGPSG